MFMGPRNWFQGMNSASLCSLAGRYDNPIPPRFLAPIEFLKIPALISKVYLGSMSRDAHTAQLTAVQIGWDPATATSPIPPHWDSYTRAFLVSKDRRHLFVTLCRRRYPTFSCGLSFHDPNILFLFTFPHFNLSSFLNLSTVHLSLPSKGLRSFSFGSQETTPSIWIGKPPYPQYSVIVKSREMTGRSQTPAVVAGGRGKDDRKQNTLAVLTYRILSLHLFFPLSPL